MKVKISKIPKTKNGNIVTELLREKVSEYEITSPVIEINFYEDYEEYRRCFDLKLLNYYNFLNIMPRDDPYGKGMIFSVNPVSFG